MKSSAYILILFVSVCLALVSCEKVELPDEKNDVTVEKSDVSTFPGSLWGYLATFSLENGEMTDSSSSLTVFDGYEDYGTRDNPFNVYDYKTGYVNYVLSASVEYVDNVWVRGYVVGYINGKSLSKTVFSSGNVATNVVLASCPDESSYEKCIPVQLSSSSSYAEVQAILNLRDNPDILGKEVMVCGRATRYMSCFGMKNTKVCVVL